MKHQKYEKIRPGRGVGNGLKIRWNIDWKMEAWEEQNLCFFIVFSIESCFRRFSKKLETLIENCSQNVAKIDSNSDMWRSRAGFLRFRGGF